MRLKGKNAIVIGAGSGIGRAISIGFAREGANVIVGDVNLSSAQDTVAQIRTRNGEATEVEVDVCQRKQVEKLLHESQRAYGQVDIMVYSAGVLSRTPFLDLSEEEWDRVMSINLKGMFLCGQLVARHMIEQGSGAIINVTSQLAEVASPNKAHYHASKGGAKMLTRSMALELAPYGIRVNALAPGVTNTPIAPIDTPEGMAHRRRVLEHVPLGRAAEPEEMVGAAIFLASNEASYMIGSTIVVDGGYLLI